MGDDYNRAEDTGDITSRKRHRRLNSGSILIFTLRKVVINHFHRGFERRKLHHGI